jgi:hypothetical protein
MICGLARFAVWESTLQDQLSIRLPKSQWNSGSLIIWSPESRSAHGFDSPGDQEAPKWSDKLLIIDSHELVQTMPEPETYQHEAAIVLSGEAQENFDFETQAGLSSLSLSLPEEDEEGEEGMVPLHLMYANRGESPEVIRGNNAAVASDTVGSPTRDLMLAHLTDSIESRYKRRAPHHFGHRYGKYEPCGWMLPQ